MLSRWLTRLIDVEAPRNATLQSAEVCLRGLFPWWLALLLAVAAGGGFFFLYFREPPGTSTWRRIVMALLRASAFAVLLVLLMRPVLVGEYRGERPRGVVFLLDDSQSMSQSDERAASEDQVRAAIAEGAAPPSASLTDPSVARGLPATARQNVARAGLVCSALANPQLGLLDRCGDIGPLRICLFGGSLRPLAESFSEDSASRPAAGKLVQSITRQMKADQPQTALADAIYETAQGGGGDPPAAIVVWTDGQDNASRLPLDEAARRCGEMGVPLHVCGVGVTERKMLRINDVDVADTLFCDDNISVPIRWQSRGIASGTIELTLALGGREVARRQVPVHSGEDLRESLSFVPKKSAGVPEKTELVASLRLKEEPSVHSELRRRVSVANRKIKVLYIENAPRWQYKYLQSALLRDRRVDASFLLAAGDVDTMRSGPPYLPSVPSRDKLFTFDLLILGDVPASYLGSQNLESIRDFVDQGGGLVLIAGSQHMPAEYAKSPLAEVFPVECPLVKMAAAEEARPKPFLPALTDAGRRSEMMALAEEQAASLEIWRQLPAWYWHYPVSKLRPAATALLAHPTKKNSEGAMPLIASQSYGRGSVLFLAGDETWRWRLDGGEKHFVRFWGQVVYQFGLPHLVHGAPKAQLALEHPKPLLGHPCAVFARLFDENYRPLSDSRVAVRLECVEGAAGQRAPREIRLEAIAGQPGLYRGTVANDVAGQFELQLDSPVATSLSYEVVRPPQRELEAEGMAEGALRELAQASGGKFYREEDLRLLPQQIEPRQVQFTMQVEKLLWNPLMMILFVGLVTMEWVLRKFSNLI